MEQTLTVYISTVMHFDGYMVNYCLDDMPPHQFAGPFATVDEAKASVTVPVEWADPNYEVCGDDVVAVGQ
jgi:hypothetical protein